MYESFETVKEKEELLANIMIEDREDNEDEQNEFTRKMKPHLHSIIGSFYPIKQTGGANESDKVAEMMNLPKATVNNMKASVTGNSVQSGEPYDPEKVSGIDEMYTKIITASDNIKVFTLSDETWRVFFRPGLIVIILVPNFAMVLNVCCRAPSPMEIIEITDATPIIIPRAVKKVRIEFAIRLRKAILKRSYKSIMPILFPLQHLDVIYHPSFE